MKICTEITGTQSKWLLENSVTKGQSNAGQGKVKAQHIKDALQEYIVNEEKKKETPEWKRMEGATVFDLESGSEIEEVGNK